MPSLSFQDKGRIPDDSDSVLSQADGSEMRVDVKLSMAAQTGRKGASGKEIRHKEALKVKSYLDGHEVQSLLQMMMHSLFLEQPENPVAFMVKYLQGVSQPRAGGSPVAYIGPRGFLCCVLYPFFGLCLCPAFQSLQKQEAR